MSLYSALARPVLFSLDAERAHDLTMTTLAVPFLPSLLAITAARDEPRLHQHAFGVSFRNPIGLAAGLDKQGAAVTAWSALGFGFAEIGTVTPRPQPGNPRPRLFRLRDDRAIINRFGFNSAGAVQVASNLTRSRAVRLTPPGSHPEFRVGINIGKNKLTPNEHAADDYVKAVEVLHPFADYIVINVSSPNTAGLRSLQESASIRPLVERVVSAAKSASHQAPVLVKVSPDMDDRDLIASVEAAAEGGAQGVIATNTTLSRDGLAAIPTLAAESGGLSGAPLRERANSICRVLFTRLRGELPIIGVGGIFTADDAYQRIRAGAALIQLYTGFIYEGPGVISRISAGLAARLERDGFSSITEAVGIDAKRRST